MYFFLQKKSKKIKGYSLAGKNHSSLFSILLLEKCYQKLGLIDEGTYGKVFRAKKINNKNIYACKKIQLEYRFNDNLSTSLREINLLLSLKHPNIIFAKETRLGKSLNSAFIIMEYCEYDLKSILNSKIKFSLYQIKYIMKQIIRGIKTLHENWIIHRDIKTSNILLNTKGIIKICDFGLARFCHQIRNSLTPGVVTLWYRAPEILLGQNIYTAAVDVWSVGCIFGELILNEVLFSGKTELDQLSKIFGLLGTPTSEIWLGLHLLPTIRRIKFPIQPFNHLTKKFFSRLDFNGIELLHRFFSFDPSKRIGLNTALNHPFFF